LALFAFQPAPSNRKEREDDAKLAKVQAESQLPLQSRTLLRFDDFFGGESRKDSVRIM
jgi:hypothetical protein